MLEILMWASWIGFTAYSIWYFTKAKHYFPITVNEAKILWKIHKQHIGCVSKKWRVIKRGNNVVGFECECGYRHVQRRPIVSGAPALNVNAQLSEISAFDKLHTSYKSK
jgi:hypothetical protein